MVAAAPQLDVFESSAGDADAGEDRGGPEKLAGPLGFEAQFPVGELEIAPGVSTAWNALAPGLRHRVAALFDRSCAPAARSFEVEGRMPEDFARDLACGGCGFRAAFPTLTRRIVAIVGTPSHPLVRVVCQGKHLAPFFDLLAPTGRRVQFDVMHRLVVGGDHLIEDRVALDLRAIVLQLAGSPAPTLGPFYDESHDQRVRPLHLSRGHVTFLASDGPRFARS
jgi:hypothetical protein